MPVSGIIRVMEKAARKAGQRLRRDFGEVEHLQVSRKGPADFVSKADQAAERTIYDELSAARPDWGFETKSAGPRASFRTPVGPVVVLAQEPTHEVQRSVCVCPERSVKMRTKV